LTNGQVLASEVNKGVTVMTEINMLGVNSWVDNTQGLEQQQREISEKLHFSRTMAERQRLADLQNEVAEDFRQMNELRNKSYEVAIANKAKIKSLNDEAEKLRLESVDLSVDAWQLENNLKAKRAEMWQLEKAIADSKNAG
jgi:post-segregation antitoxin (ccd killing protein)